VISSATPDATFDALMMPTNQPMIVVTTAIDDERAGCLVGFHAQCSIEPRRYALWLSKANHTFHVANSASHFGIHFLGRANHDLAELFGGSTQDEIDKFARCEWSSGTAGVPLLTRCANRMVAKRVAQFDDGGDHVCVVVEPVEVVVHRGNASRLRLSEVSDIGAGHQPDEHLA